MSCFSCILLSDINNPYKHLLLRLTFIFRSYGFFFVINTLWVKLFRTTIINKQGRMNLFTGNFAWYSYFFNIPKSSRPINLLGFFEDAPFFTYIFFYFTIYLSLLILSLLLLFLFRGEIAPATNWIARNRTVWSFNCVFTQNVFTNHI